MTEVVPLSLATLPPELINMVASHLNTPADLHSLRLAGSGLYKASKAQFAIKTFQSPQWRLMFSQRMLEMLEEIAKDDDYAPYVTSLDLNLRYYRILRSILLSTRFPGMEEDCFRTNDDTFWRHESDEAGGCEWSNGDIWGDVEEEELDSDDGESIEYDEDERPPRASAATVSALVAYLHAEDDFWTEESSWVRLTKVFGRLPRLKKVSTCSSYHDLFSKQLQRLAREINIISPDLFDLLDPLRGIFAFHPRDTEYLLRATRQLIDAIKLSGLKVEHISAPTLWERGAAPEFLESVRVLNWTVSSERQSCSTEILFFKHLDPMFAAMPNLTHVKLSGGWSEMEDYETKGLCQITWPFSLKALTLCSVTISASQLSFLERLPASLSFLALNGVRTGVNAETRATDIVTWFSALESCLPSRKSLHLLLKDLMFLRLGTFMQFPTSSQDGISTPDHALNVELFNRTNLELMSPTWLEYTQKSS